jgi:penicillin-binding protein activator
MSTMGRFGVLALTFGVSVAAVGCGPKAVRGDEVAGLDDQAMSTGLDRRDLQKLLQENMKALETAPVIKRWEGEQMPSVAVLPLRNETTEHVESSLDALISDIETTLVNAGHVRVISMEQQGKLIQEIRQQYSGAFDPSQISTWGKQIGARYIVTGKVFTSDERQDGERRVQYYMFIQVLEVETGQILFQHKSAVTKAII